MIKEKDKIQNQIEVTTSTKDYIEKLDKDVNQDRINHGKKLLKLKIEK